MGSRPELACPVSSLVLIISCRRLMFFAVVNESRELQMKEVWSFRGAAAAATGMQMRQYLRKEGNSRPLCYRNSFAWSGCWVPNVGALARLVPSWLAFHPNVMYVQRCSCSLCRHQAFSRLEDTPNVTSSGVCSGCYYRSHQLRSLVESMPDCFKLNRSWPTDRVRLVGSPRFRGGECYWRVYG